MKPLKIATLVLAVVGLVIALVGYKKLSDYKEVDKAWQQAADARQQLLRHREPSGAIDPAYRQALDEASLVANRLSDARNQQRASCQRVVQVSAIPIGLGLILGIVGLFRRPRGWMPVASTLCAVAAGGLIGSMLGAGVF